MFEGIVNFFKKVGKNDKENSKNAAKERLHLVLAQDRANISADFLEMMKQEIIDVIKKYIDIDEEAIDVRMTNKTGEDGVVGAPALYANIPILTIKNEARKLEGTIEKKNKDNKETVKENQNDNKLVNCNIEKSENKEIKEQKVKDKNLENKDTQIKEKSEEVLKEEKTKENVNNKSKNQNNKNTSKKGKKKKKR